MKAQQYIKTGNDESYTYPNLINILKPFVKVFANGRDITIWCPFDNESSNYVKLLRMWGYKVVYSHIDNGQDFFKYEPNEHWDIIISNPPFQNKRIFFERAISFGKPFALVAPITWLNDGTPNKIFKNKLELIIPNRRARFFNPDGDFIGKSPSFKSAYFCQGFCKKDINFVDMEKEII